MRTVFGTLSIFVSVLLIGPGVLGGPGQSASPTVLTPPFHHLKAISTNTTSGTIGCAFGTILASPTFNSSTGTGGTHLRADAPTCTASKQYFSSSYAYGQIELKKVIRAPPTGFDTILFNLSIQVHALWNISVPTCTNKAGKLALLCNEQTSYSLLAGGGLVMKKPFLRIPNSGWYSIWNNGTSNYWGSTGASGGGFFYYKCTRAGVCTKSQSATLGGNTTGNYSLVLGLQGDLNNSYNYTAHIFLLVQVASERSFSTATKIVGGSAFAEIAITYRLNSITIP